MVVSWDSAGLNLELNVLSSGGGGDGGLKELMLPWSSTYLYLMF